MREVLECELDVVAVEEELGEILELEDVGDLEPFQKEEERGGDGFLADFAGADVVEVFDGHVGGFGRWWWHREGLCGDVGVGFGTVEAAAGLAGVSDVSVADGDVLHVGEHDFHKDDDEGLHVWEGVVEEMIHSMHAYSEARIGKAFEIIVVHLRLSMVLAIILRLRSLFSSPSSIILHEELPLFPQLSHCSCHPHSTCKELASFYHRRRHITPFPLLTDHHVLQLGITFPA